MEPPGTPPSPPTPPPQRLGSRTARRPRSRSPVPRPEWQDATLGPSALAAGPPPGVVASDTPPRGVRSPPPPPSPAEQRARALRLSRLTKRGEEQRRRARHRKEERKAARERMLRGPKVKHAPADWVPAGRRDFRAVPWDMCYEPYSPPPEPRRAPRSLSPALQSPPRGSMCRTIAAPPVASPPPAACSLSAADSAEGSLGEGSSQPPPAAPSPPPQPVAVASDHDAASSPRGLQVAVRASLSPAPAPGPPGSVSPPPSPPPPSPPPELGEQELGSWLARLCAIKGAHQKACSELMRLSTAPRTPAVAQREMELRREVELYHSRVPHVSEEMAQYRLAAKRFVKESHREARQQRDAMCERAPLRPVVLLVSVDGLVLPHPCGDVVEISVALLTAGEPPAMVASSAWAHKQGSWRCDLPLRRRQGTLCLRVRIGLSVLSASTTVTCEDPPQGRRLQLLGPSGQAAAADAAAGSGETPALISLRTTAASSKTVNMAGALRLLRQQLCGQPVTAPTLLIVKVRWAELPASGDCASVCVRLRRVPLGAPRPPALSVPVETQPPPDASCMLFGDGPSRDWGGSSRRFRSPLDGQIQIPMEHRAEELLLQVVGWRPLRAGHVLGEAVFWALPGIPEEQTAVSLPLQPEGGGFDSRSTLLLPRQPEQGLGEVTLSYQVHTYGEAEPATGLADSSFLSTAVSQPTSLPTSTPAKSAVLPRQIPSPTLSQPPGGLSQEPQAALAESAGPDELAGAAGAVRALPRRCRLCIERAEGIPPDVTLCYAEVRQATRGSRYPASPPFAAPGDAPAVPTSAVVSSAVSVCTTAVCGGAVWACSVDMDAYGDALYILVRLCTRRTDRSNTFGAISSDPVIGDAEMRLPCSSWRTVRQGPPDGSNPPRGPADPEEPQADSEPQRGVRREAWVDLTPPGSEEAARTGPPWFTPVQPYLARVLLSWEWCGPMQLGRRTLVAQGETRGCGVASEQCVAATPPLPGPLAAARFSLHWRGGGAVSVVARVAGSSGHTGGCAEFAVGGVEDAAAGHRPPQLRSWQGTVPYLEGAQAGDSVQLRIVPAAQPLGGASATSEPPVVERASVWVDVVTEESSCVGLLLEVIEARDLTGGTGTLSEAPEVVSTTAIAATGIGDAGCWVVARRGNWSAPERRCEVSTATGRWGGGGRYLFGERLFIPSTSGDFGGATLSVYRGGDCVGVCTVHTVPPRGAGWLLLREPTQHSDRSGKHCGRLWIRWHWCWGGAASSPRRSAGKVGGQRLLAITSLAVQDPGKDTHLVTGARAVHLPALNKVFMFGGIDRTGEPEARVGVYDTERRLWGVPVSGWGSAAFRFQLRTEHTAVLYQETRVVVFGGTGPGGRLRRGRSGAAALQVAAPSARRLRRHAVSSSMMADGEAQPPDVGAASPTADWAVVRYEGTMHSGDAEGEEGYHDSTAEFDVATGTWKELATWGSAQDFRAGHTAVVSGHRMLVWGGRRVQVREERVPAASSADLSGVFISGTTEVQVAYSWKESRRSDLVCLDLQSLRWKKVTQEGGVPRARCGHTASLREELMTVFGGAADALPTDWLGNDPHAAAAAARCAPATAMRRGTRGRNRSPSDSEEEDLRGDAGPRALPLSPARGRGSPSREPSRRRLKREARRRAAAEAAEAAARRAAEVVAAGAPDFLGDTHVFNLNTRKWRRVDATGDFPEPRHKHSASLLPGMDALLICGGENAGGPLGNCYCLGFDGQGGGLWRRVHSAAPLRRSAHAAVVVPRFVHRCGAAAQGTDAQGKKLPFVQLYLFGGDEAPSTDEAASAASASGLVSTLARSARWSPSTAPSATAPATSSAARQLGATVVAALAHGRPKERFAGLAEHLGRLEQSRAARQEPPPAASGDAQTTLGPDQLEHMLERLSRPHHRRAAEEHARLLAADRAQEERRHAKPLGAAGAVCMDGTAGRLTASQQNAINDRLFYQPTRRRDVRRALVRQLEHDKAVKDASSAADPNTAIELAERLFYREMGKGTLAEAAYAAEEVRREMAPKKSKEEVLVMAQRLHQAGGVLHKLRNRRQPRPMDNQGAVFSVRHMLRHAKRLHHGQPINVLTEPGGSSLQRGKVRGSRGRGSSPLARGGASRGRQAGVGISDSEDDLRSGLESGGSAGSPVRAHAGSPVAGGVDA
eukprot:TRINITY_DN3993_c4_g1_i1.p1 TRINITY_DN3993_c4_g1~~TRINITY_DN3993_c4_g1_i1.p1  ORF type:complete len:2161 (+),score=372.21 TRINITY_DN3993_c4_g1_i1:23-6484(+)